MARSKDLLYYISILCFLSLSDSSNAETIITKEADISAWNSKTIIPIELSHHKNTNSNKQNAQAQNGAVKVKTHILELSNPLTFAEHDEKRGELVYFQDYSRTISFLDTKNSKLLPKKIICNETISAFYIFGNEMISILQSERLVIYDLDTLKIVNQWVPPCGNSVIGLGKSDTNQKSPIIVMTGKINKLKKSIDNMKIYFLSPRDLSIENWKITQIDELINIKPAPEFFGACKPKFKIHVKNDGKVAELPWAELIFKSRRKIVVNKLKVWEHSHSISQIPRIINKNIFIPSISSYRDSKIITDKRQNVFRPGFLERKHLVYQDGLFFSETFNTLKINKKIIKPITIIDAKNMHPLYTINLPMIRDQDSTYKHIIFSNRLIYCNNTNKLIWISPDGKSLSITDYNHLKIKNSIPHALGSKFFTIPISGIARHKIQINPPKSVKGYTLLESPPGTTIKDGFLIWKKPVNFKFTNQPLFFKVNVILINDQSLDVEYFAVMQKS